MHLKPNCDAIKFGVEPSKKAPVISVASPATKVNLENVAGPKVHISGCRDKAKEEMQLRSPPQPTDAATGRRRPVRLPAFIQFLPSTPQKSA